MNHRISRISAMTLFVVVFLLAGVASAFAISRNTALSRAQSWVDIPIKYSQTHYYKSYRTDCSGFTSMVWQLGTSLSTRSLHNVSTKITLAQLQPGDAMIKYNYHAQVFYGWVDETHTKYVTYEQTGPTTKSSIADINEDYAFGYRPYRYSKMTSSAPSRNALKNGSFDVWDHQWNGDEDPIWWVDNNNSNWWESDDTTWHCKVVGTTTKNSLELRNVPPVESPRGPLSDDSSQTVSVSQSAPVLAQTEYTFAIWAKTAADPSLFGVNLKYLDVDGNVLSEMTTSGDVWAIDSSRFKLMTMTATTPTGTVQAIAMLSLADGSVDATGNPVAASVLLDAISLTHKYSSSASLKADVKSIIHGHYATLTAKLKAGDGGTFSNTYVRFEVKTKTSSKYTLLKNVKVSSTGVATYRYKTVSHGTRYHRAVFLGNSTFFPAPVQNGIALIVR